MTVSTRAIVATALFALSLAGCGGGKANSSAGSTATSPPMTEAQRESAALPHATAAAVPKNLNCGATKPVWVNLHTKAYHEPGDPYFGRTKEGQYMCPSVAVAQGYHAAGKRHKASSTSAPQ
jgi:hypothetical protein